MPRLITFGGLSVRNGTAINGLANPRSRLAILAVLAVAGDRGVRREKLATLFWPESDDEKARNALRQALFTLKRDLGSGDITLGTADLRLNPEVLTADVTEFDVALRAERFEDAAALYGGPFLDGVFLRESPEFERWADEQRIRLSREYDRALEKAAAAAGGRGDLRSAATWWERRSAHDPLSGRVARLYMEALVAAGDRERAIRHATVHSQLVRQELEAEPDAEVLRLAESLRNARGTSGADELRRTESPSPSTALVAPSLETPPNAAAPAAPPTGTPSVATKRRALTRVALFCTPLLAAGIYFALHGGQPATPTSIRTVAVAAFTNETGDSALGLIGDMIRNEISAGFTEERLADVMPRDVSDSLTGRRVSWTKSRLRKIGRHVRYIVSGRYVVANDSLYVHTELTDAFQGSVFRSLTTAVPAAEPAVTARAVRDAVLAAVAMRLDPLLHDLADVVTPPANFDAYDQFAEGVRQSGPDAEQHALEYFRKAVAFDSGYFIVRLWSVFFGALAAPDRDSALALLVADRGSLSEFERAWLDYYLVIRDADPRRRFLAAAKLSQLAPRSDWFHWVYANDAGRIGRYDDAVAALEQIDLSGPWMTRIKHDAYWAFLRHLLHARGGHERALVAVRRAKGFRPDLGVLQQYELNELAALGRMDEVEQMLERIDDWSRSPVDGSRQLVPYVTTVEELSAHGHRREAARVAVKFDSVLALLPDSSRNRPGLKTLRARVLITLGRYDESVVLLRAVGPQPPWETLSRLAIALAAAGKRAEAESTASALVAMSQGRMRPAACARAAQAYALLGDRNRASAAFRDAILAGADWSSLRHDPPAADSLRHYPLPEALVREGHLSTTSCVKVARGPDSSTHDSRGIKPALRFAQSEARAR